LQPACEAPDWGQTRQGAEPSRPPTTHATPALRAAGTDFGTAGNLDRGRTEEGRGLASIAQLFRRAAKIALRDADTPKPRHRRKRGETEGQFHQLRRRILRRFALRPQFFKAAAKAGRRAAANATIPESAAAGYAPSPWRHPLSGMDFYSSDLAGFADADEGFDNGLTCNNSLEA
jgi:hypothetical protein